MDKAVVFMFAGQGSHYYQMGKNLFERHHVFRRWMLLLDDLCLALTGESVLRLLYEERRPCTEPFVRLLYTHPAIFMVEYSLAQVLLESGIRPDFVLGSSVGEFASAALAGIMGVEDALESVFKQAECIETCCEKGGMLAVIHNAALYKTHSLLNKNSELAAINYGSHFVVSGEAGNLNELERLLKNENVVCQPLPVSYGFHSSFIEPAAAVYKKFLRQKCYQTPRVSFLSCLTGSSLSNVPPDYLWHVVRDPIQFPGALVELEAGGGCIYLDLGPGGTLANFAKRNLASTSKSKTRAVITPFNQDMKNLEEINKLFSFKKGGG